jgi:UrcA family protein
MKRILIAAACLAAFGAASATAQEQTAPAARAVPVSYAGLDLSRTDEAAQLLNRMRTAAQRACTAEVAGRAAAPLRRAIETCREDAVATAVARLDQPELTRLHEATRR